MDRKDRRNSDLCAQWKAADSAFDAARAAERQTVIGWIGLALGFITMAAALAAAWFARKAAIETEKAANAAIDAVRETREANAIARGSADQQLRPYLTVDGESVQLIRKPEDDYFENGRKVYARWLQVKVKNLGQTPAVGVSITPAFYQQARGSDFTHNIHWQSDEANVVIPPTDEFIFHIDYGQYADHTANFITAEQDLHVYFRITYRSVRGTEHVLEMHFLCDDKVWPDKPWRLCWRPFVST